MKYINNFIVIVLFLNACTHKTSETSSKTLTTSITNQDAIIDSLEEYDIQDTVMLNTILNICKSTHFNHDEYFILDFFTSELTPDYYFLCVCSFDYDSISSKMVDAFVVLDKKIFMFNKKNLPPIYSDLKRCQKFDYSKDSIPDVGGGFIYWIWGSFNEFSYVIREECCE